MVSYTLEAIKRNLEKGAEALSERIGEKVEMKIRKWEGMIMRKMLGGFIALTGAVFLSIGTYYFLNEILLLGRTLSFVIIGLILIFIGIFLRTNERGWRENER